MSAVRIIVLGNEIKRIEFDSRDNVKKVMDYASFIITQVAQVFFNGECVIKVNKKEVSSEEDLRILLSKNIKGGKDIIVEINKLKREQLDSRIPNEIIVHAAGLTPPLLAKF